MKKDQETDYVIKMRKAFSNKNSIFQNGELNHKYFQTKIGQYWTEEDNEKLIDGIHEFGVGAWDKIKKKYLKNWSETDLELRTGYLLKCVDTSKYSFICLSREEIQKISKENETEGKEKNKFKYGVYFN